jgi:hypothetical protein
VAPGDGLLGRFPLESTSWLIWKPLDYATVLFELGFAVAIFSPRRLRLFCAGAVVFHFAIFLAFGIDFTGSVVAYAIFFQWSTVVDRLQLPRRRHPPTDAVGAFLSRTGIAVGPAVALAGIGLFLLRDRFAAPMRYVASLVVTNPDRPATLSLFAIALLLAVAYLVLRAMGSAKQVGRRTPTRVSAAHVALPAGAGTYTSSRSDPSNSASGPVPTKR